MLLGSLRVLAIRCCDQCFASRPAGVGAQPLYTVNATWAPAASTAAAAAATAASTGATRRLGFRAFALVYNDFDIILDHFSTLVSVGKI